MTKTPASKLIEAVVQGADPRRLLEAPPGNGYIAVEYEGDYPLDHSELWGKKFSTEQQALSAAKSVWQKNKSKHGSDYYVLVFSEEDDTGSHPLACVCSQGVLTGHAAQKFADQY